MGSLKSSSDPDVIGPEKDFVDLQEASEFTNSYVKCVKNGYTYSALSQAHGVIKASLSQVLIYYK